MKERSGMAYDVVAFSMDSTAVSWTPEEEGIFHRLLRLAWVEHGIPDGDRPEGLRKLAYWCRVAEDVMSRVWEVLRECWPLNQRTGKRTNPKQEAERRYREKKKIAAKESAKTRWAASTSKRKSKPHANALRTHCEPDASHPTPSLPFPTQSILKEGSSKEESVTPESVGLVLLGAHRSVVLKQEELERAREQLGSAFDDLVEELDDYSQSRPDKFRQYKNHFAVLRQWHRKRQQQPRPGVSYGRETRVERIERRNDETTRRDFEDVVGRIGQAVPKRVDVRGDADVPGRAPPGGPIGSA